MTGLNSWIPKSVAGLGTLNNIDRSLDPLRLAGHRLQMGAAARFDDSIRKLCAQINQLTGKNPTIAVMSPLVENLIAQEQRAQIRFDNAGGSGAAMMIGAGVSGLSIKTAKGNVEVVTSAFAPVDTIWVLNETDLALYYLADEGGDFVFFKRIQRLEVSSNLPMTQLGLKQGLKALVTLLCSVRGYMAVLTLKPLKFQHSHNSSSNYFRDII